MEWGNRTDSYSHFEITNLKNYDGTIDPNSIETPQDEFKIRRDLNYDPTDLNPSTPSS